MTELNSAKVYFSANKLQVYVFGEDDDLKKLLKPLQEIAKKFKSQMMFVAAEYVNGKLVSVDPKNSLHVALIDKENIHPHPSSDSTSHQNYGEDYSLGLVDESKGRKRALDPINANRQALSIGPAEINDSFELEL
ncbi:hypothetical protein C2S51_001740 [Perilla frutescens var. frutescens]|nr:hypothetical protein C2S51_001740 [Perilla frutescens var. frutescens]